MRKLPKTMIVFAPHPDDETWGCGGIIAKRVNEGYNVQIVLLTDGRHAFSKVFGIDSDPTPEELRQIRKEETTRAVKILGVSEEKIIFLDFEDGTLDKHEQEVMDQICEVLKKHPPVEVYIPYIRDAHPDHKAANRLVKRCLQKLGLNPRRYQYSITQEYARVGPILDSLRGLFRTVKVEVDISDVLHLKDKAAREFKSEITIISEKQKKPLTDSIEKYLKSKETFYLD